MVQLDERNTLRLPPVRICCRACFAQPFIAWPSLSCSRWRVLGLSWSVPLVCCSVVGVR